MAPAAGPGATSLAPAAEVTVAPPAPRRRFGFGKFLLLLIVLGGAGLAAWWFLGNGAVVLKPFLQPYFPRLF